jgi:hypothetical protein
MKEVVLFFPLQFKSFESVLCHDSCRIEIKIHLHAQYFHVFYCIFAPCFSVLYPQTTLENLKRTYIMPYPNKLECFTLYVTYTLV